MELSKINLYEILDSRGNPTVYCKMRDDDGNIGTFKVPSGASTGSQEALEKRDRDKKRFHGKGVKGIIQEFEEKYLESIQKKEFKNQEEFDRFLIELDATEQKENIGANVILALSGAFLRLNCEQHMKSSSGAENLKGLHSFIKLDFDFPRLEKFPRPMANVINGGDHADSGLAFQEFMIVPTYIFTFPDMVRALSEIYHQLKTNLQKDGYSTALGDEGGFAPKLKNHQEALAYLKDAVCQAGYRLAADVCFSFDIAANSFYSKEEKKYILKNENKKLDSKEFIEYAKKLFSGYPIESIEDPFYEKDYEAWKIVTKEFGNTFHIVGDDLLVTNKKLLQKAIDEKWCNAILVKVNQIGTVSETIETIKLAQKNRFNVIISHRSGETEDDFIADLAIGVNADYVKFGSVARSERTCKYNRLLEIYHDLNS